MKRFKIANKSKNKTGSANHKALLIFIILMIVGCAAGFFSGFFMSKTGFDGFTVSLKAVVENFASNIAPWLIIAVAAALPLVCIPRNIQTRRRIANLNGEDELEYEKINRSLSVTLWLVNAGFILMFFLMAVIYSAYNKNQSSGKNILFVADCIAFLIIVIETVVITQMTVRLTEKISPEKGSVPVYDMKFDKKWMKNSDEAEKIAAGKCAFKAFRATSKVCAGLAAFLAVGALIFDIGFLPSLAVCVVWFICQTVYFYESIKLSKPGNKLT